MNRPSKIAVIGRECVACGCCAAACPRKAIRILSGVIAQVNETCCVGCGICARICPAAVITIAERREGA